MDQAHQQIEQTAPDQGSAVERIRRLLARALAGATPPTPVVSDGPAAVSFGTERVLEAPDLPVPAHVLEATELLAFLYARWQPVVVPPRRGRPRSRPARLHNPAGTITQLSRLWAKERGRSARWAALQLRELYMSGAIRREPLGRGFAWRLLADPELAFDQLWRRTGFVRDKKGASWAIARASGRTDEATSTTVQ